MTLPANLTINGITIYTAKVTENYTKILLIIKPGTSTESGNPKPTKIVDLRRVEHRFTVKGMVALADIAGLRTTFKSKGIVTMVWDSDSDGVGENYDVVMDKLDIEKDTTEQDEKEITFTCVEGTNVG